MEVVRNENAQKATWAASEELNKILKEHSATPILLLLSGGTAMGILTSLDPALLPQGSSVSVVDERFSEVESVNTFSQILQTDFYERAMERSVTFIRTKVLPNETLEIFADRYETSLKSWKKNNPNGIVVVTLGMGADSHTAGIFPHPEDPQKFVSLFENPEEWVVGYEITPDKSAHTKRVTVTIAFLLTMVDYAVIYVAGESKKEALNKALEEGEFIDAPARVWKKMKNSKLFTDIRQ